MPTPDADHRPHHRKYRDLLACIAYAAGLLLVFVLSLYLLPEDSGVGRMLHEAGLLLPNEPQDAPPASSEAASALPGEPSASR